MIKKWDVDVDVLFETIPLEVPPDLDLDLDQRFSPTTVDWWSQVVFATNGPLLRKTFENALGIIYVMEWFHSSLKRWSW